MGFDSGIVLPSTAVFLVQVSSFLELRFDGWYTLVHSLAAESFNILIMESNNSIWVSFNLYTSRVERQYDIIASFRAQSMLGYDSCIKCFQFVNYQLLKLHMCQIPANYKNWWLICRRVYFKNEFHKWASNTNNVGK